MSTGKWILNTNKQAEIKKKNTTAKLVFIYLLISLFVFTLLSIRTLLGWDSATFTYYPSNWGANFSRWFDNLFVTMLFSAGVSLIIFLIVKSFINKSLRNSDVVCLNCQKIKQTDSELYCQCGTQYVSINDVKWVE